MNWVTIVLTDIQLDALEDAAREAKETPTALATRLVTRHLSPEDRWRIVPTTRPGVVCQFESGD